MKLRIKGNSLRLRITRPELAALQQGREVSETIHFGAGLDSGPEQSFRYALAAAAQPVPVAVAFRDNAIAVSISLDQLRAWSEESQVGIYATLETGPAGSLEVAVEKDFACLDRGGDEDEDAFPNPLVGKSC
jgi:hypothetical protein